MNEWLIKLTAVIIATSCTHLLLPSGKTKNACKTVLSLVCLVVLIEPLALFADYEFSFSEVFAPSQNEQEYEVGTNEYISNMCENEIIKFLTDKGIICEKCEVLGYMDSGKFLLEKISIQIKNSVISGKDEHIIDSVEIRKTLAQILSISEDKVFVYE